MSILRRLWRNQLKMSTTGQSASTHQSPAPGPYTSETYTRRADHTPNTSHSDETTYILTLHSDPAHHNRITALRTKYFPRHLNKLSAHIALFRALPGSHLPIIEADLSTTCTYHQPFTIHTTTPFLLKHGVGINVAAEPAREIYKELRGKWEGFLSQQDKGFRPHYTIQNKAEEGVPEKTLEEVKGSRVEGMKGEVSGLTLWRYEKGFWRRGKDFGFGVGKGEEGEKAEDAEKIG